MSDSSPSEQDTHRDGLSPREFSLRKYEAWIGLLKVAIGTALVGLAGVLVPAAVEFWKSHYENERKNIELKLSQQNSQQQYVKEFLSTALAQDIELRIRFAEYFSTVSDDAYKKDWNAYLQILSDKRKTIRTDINTLEGDVLNLLAKGEKTTADQITQAEKERKLEWAYRELGYVQRDRSIVPSASEGRALAGAAPTTTPRSVPPNLDGFIMFISRTHTEQRPGMAFARTVGSYHVTFGGQRIPDLEGTTVERQGPGDNSATGVQTHQRIEAGIYPLFTCGGTRYVTLGYATDPNQASRPWPAICIGETGSRSGLLIQPAAGYLMSIGTINLSTPLDGPSANITFPESRQKVVALIEAMKAKLGTSLPTASNVRIPNAWLFISEELASASTAN